MPLLPGGPQQNKRGSRVFLEQQIRLYMTGFIIPFIFQKNIYQLCCSLIPRFDELGWNISHFSQIYIHLQRFKGINITNPTEQLTPFLVLQQMILNSTLLNVQEQGPQQEGNSIVIINRAAKSHYDSTWLPPPPDPDANHVSIL